MAPVFAIAPLPLSRPRHSSQERPISFIRNLAHFGNIDTVRVEPPFRTFVRMAIAKSQVVGAKPLLAFDLFIKERMIQRATHHVNAAKQLS